MDVSELLLPSRSSRCNSIIKSRRRSMIRKVSDVEVSPVEHARRLLSTHKLQRTAMHTRFKTLQAWINYELRKRVAHGDHIQTNNMCENFVSVIMSPLIELLTNKDFRLGRLSSPHIDYKQRLTAVKELCNYLSANFLYICQRRNMRKDKLGILNKSNIVNGDPDAIMSFTWVLCYNFHVWPLCSAMFTRIQRTAAGRLIWKAWKRYKYYKSSICIQNFRFELKCWHKTVQKHVKLPKSDTDYQYHMALLVNERISKIPPDRLHHSSNWPPKPIESILQLNVNVLIALIMAYFPGTVDPYSLINDQHTLLISLYIIKQLFDAQFMLTVEDFIDERLIDPMAYSVFVAHIIDNGDAIVGELKRRHSYNLMCMLLDRTNQVHNETYVYSSSQPDFLLNILRRSKIMKELSWIENRLKMFKKCSVSNRISIHCDNIETIKVDVHQYLIDSMNLKYATILVDDRDRISEFVWQRKISLKMTKGLGFYRLNRQEHISADRQVVLIKKNGLNANGNDGMKNQENRCSDEPNPAITFNSRTIPSKDDANTTSSYESGDRSDTEPVNSQQKTLHIPVVSGTGVLQMPSRSMTTYAFTLPQRTYAVERSNTLFSSNQASGMPLEIAFNQSRKKNHLLYLPLATLQEISSSNPIEHTGNTLANRLAVMSASIGRDGDSASHTGGISLHPVMLDQFDVYVEALTGNKTLTTNDVFLYQVWASDTIVSSERLLIKAAKTGDIDTARELVQFHSRHEYDKSFINCRDPSTGNTPLHFAARSGLLHMCLFLISEGADVHSLNMRRRLPVMLAFEHNRRDIGEALILSGSDIHLISSDGKTALDYIKSNTQTHDMEALYHMIRAVRRALLSSKDTTQLEQFIEPILLVHVAKRENGQRFASKLEIMHPLTSNAIKRRDKLIPNIEEITEIMDKWALLRKSVLKKTESSPIENRKTMLHSKNNPSPVKATEKKIESDANDRPVPIDSSDVVWTYPSGRIMNAAVLTLRDHLDTFSTRQCMATHVYPELLGYCRVEARGIDGQTLLHIAARHNAIKVVRLLIAHGADVNARSITERQMALHMTSNLKVMDVLLANNASPDAKDAKGDTPLHIYARSGNIDAVKVLLLHDADVYIRNRQQATPLHAAASRGFIDIVRLFADRQEGEAKKRIAHGLTPKPTHVIANADEPTPLYLATYNCFWMIVKFFLHDGEIYQPGEAQTLLQDVILSTSVRNDDKVKTMQYLIWYGADISLCSHGFELYECDALNCQGVSLLHLAARVGCVPVVLSALLDMHRSDSGTFVLLPELIEVKRVMINESKSSSTLTLCSKRNEDHRALLSPSKMPDLNLLDDFGETPLFSATRHGHVELASVLLEAGAVATIRNRHLETAFDVIEDYQEWLDFPLFSWQNKVSIQSAYLRRDKESRYSILNKLLILRDTNEVEDAREKKNEFTSVADDVLNMAETLRSNIITTSCLPGTRRKGETPLVTLTSHTKSTPPKQGHDSDGGLETPSAKTRRRSSTVATNNDSRPTTRSSISSSLCPRLPLSSRVTSAGKSLFRMPRVHASLRQNSANSDSTNLTSSTTISPPRPLTTRPAYEPFRRDLARYNYIYSSPRASSKKTSCISDSMRKKNIFVSSWNQANIH